MSEPTINQSRPSLPTGTLPVVEWRLNGPRRENRGGNHDANNALWRIFLARMSHDPRTRTYVERRTAEGLSNPEIIRCLKRYVACELYPIVVADLTN